MKSKSSYRFATIPDLLTVQAERHAGACAMQTTAADELSYRDLHQRVKNISSQLRALGLGRRSRVSIVLPNGLDMSVMLLAVSSTSIAAPLNPSYREAEFQSYLNDIHADCVIV